MSGSQNLVSDALSRGPVETAVEPEVASLHIFSIINTTDWIAAKQRDSAEVASIISKLDENDGTVVDNTYNTFFHNFLKMSRSTQVTFYPEEDVKLAELVSGQPCIFNA
ncbi:hypothetical protein QTP88_017460 [Uroleucon formosanum]